MAQRTPSNNIAKAEPLDKKALTFTLSFSSVITMCMVLVGGIAWAFFMGVIVGRGENPKTTMPELSTILREEKGAIPPSEVLPEGTAAGNGIMQAEDLNYAASLKDKSTVKVDQGATLAQTASKPPTSANTNTAVSSGSATQAQPLQGTMLITESTADLAAQQELPEAAKPLIFDYVFQVATFNTTEAVDTLRADLEGAGLRTRMEKVGKLYRVMVLMRGTEAQAQDLRQRMIKMKLGEPLQRGKTPVT